MPNPSASQCHPSMLQLELLEPRWDREEHLYHSHSRGSGSGWSHSGTSWTWNKALASAGLQHSNPWGQGRAWQLGWERWELGSRSWPSQAVPSKGLSSLAPRRHRTAPHGHPTGFGIMLCPVPASPLPLSQNRPPTPCPEPCELCGFPSTPWVSFLPQSQDPCSHLCSQPGAMGATPIPQIPPSHPSRLAWGTQRVTGGHILRFIGKHVLRGTQGVIGIHLPVTQGDTRVYWDTHLYHYEGTQNFGDTHPCHY